MCLFGSLLLVQEWSQIWSQITAGPIHLGIAGCTDRRARGSFKVSSCASTRWQTLKKTIGSPSLTRIELSVSLPMPKQNNCSLQSGLLLLILKVFIRLTEAQTRILRKRVTPEMNFANRMPPPPQTFPTSSCHKPCVAQKSAGSMSLRSAKLACPNLRIEASHNELFVGCDYDGQCVDTDLPSMQLGQSAFLITSDAEARARLRATPRAKIGSQPLESSASPAYPCQGVGSPRQQKTGLAGAARDLGGPTG